MPTLSLFMTDGSGRPLVGRQLALHQRDGTPLGVLTTDAAGAARLGYPDGEAWTDIPLLSGVDDAAGLGWVLAVDGGPPAEGRYSRVGVPALAGPQTAFLTVTIPPAH